MTSPDIHALGGAYALDAVDDLERVAFERHLTDCETCAMDVAEYRETLTRLAEGAWSVPPPQMREQVLARAAATPQLPPAGHRRSAASPVARWRRLAAAAAVVGVLGTGVAATTYAVQEQRLAAERVTVAAAQERAARIEAVLGAADASLRTDELTGGGRVTIVTSAEQDAGVVVLADAPPPGSDRSYQLWVAEETTPISVGVLAAGQAAATELIEGVRGREAFEVSLEPAGGSPAPTLPVLVKIPLV